MQGTKSSLIRWGLIIAVVVMILPVTSFAQRRWVVVRPGRQRVMVYQPQSTVIYRRSYASPYYNYSQPYYRTGYYTQPYYSSTYYSYPYSQRYYTNGYSYSWVNPGYSAPYRQFPPRYRRSGVRLGVYLR
jgi:hypothetical protein